MNLWGMTAFLTPMGTKIPPYWSLFVYGCQWRVSLETEALSDFIAAHCLEFRFDIILRSFYCLQMIHCGRSAFRFQKM
jgi:hypothetical protein